MSGAGNRNECITNCIKNGDTGALSEKVEKSPALARKKVTRRGASPILVAVEEGHVLCVLIILQAIGPVGGSKFSQAYMYHLKGQFSPIRVAVANKNFEILALLFAFGANPAMLAPGDIDVLCSTIGTTTTNDVISHIRVFLVRCNAKQEVVNTVVQPLLGVMLNHIITKRNGSVDAVQRLWDEGVQLRVTGFTTQTSTGTLQQALEAVRLGHACIIINTLGNLTKEEYRRVFEFLTNTRKIHWLRFCMSHFMYHFNDASFITAFLRTHAGKVVQEYMHDPYYCTTHMDLFTLTYFNKVRLNEINSCLVPDILKIIFNFVGSAPELYQLVHNASD